MCIHVCGLICILSFFQPEWYFTQVLNWIRNHSDFLQHTIQPILRRTEHGLVDAKVIWKGLVTINHIVFNTF